MLLFDILSRLVFLLQQDPELGWDCVVDVLVDKKMVESTYDNKRYVITHRILNDTKFENIKSKFKTVKWESVKNNFLIIDTVNITGGGFNSINSFESIDFIANQFEEFCSENDLDPGIISISTFNNYETGWVATCDGIVDEDFKIENMFMEFLRKRNIDVD